ncbi:MAG: S8 family peptidase [Geminicoccales bacterium]
MAAVLASCGGGGSGSGNSLTDNPSTTFLAQVAEPSAPFASTDWSSTQEYQNSTGLNQLKAAEGYARRTGGLPGGQGVRIAIIDSGIDLVHPDLGNLWTQSWSAGGEGLVGDAHGTFVAGIVGARRTQTADPNDMHGMAYRATLVNFQASRPSQTPPNSNPTFATSDLVEAFSAASGLSSGNEGVESNILNLSLGAFAASDSTFSALRTAMQAAAAEDKIMVVAAGNEGLDADQSRKQQPIYPAAYADDAGIAGFAIVVGNLTSTNAAAVSSNLCGDTKDFCLFAPGSNVRSTLNGGGYGSGSGTSFAAPYVTGAAAVVKAAFPGVSSQDVVNRLLLTAADLGDPGVDTTFGRGLLDLEAAMAPVGSVGLVLSGDVKDPPISIAESTSLNLGTAFGMGKDSLGLLEKAVGFDQMGFPFPVDLGEQIATRVEDRRLGSFIGRSGAASTSTALPHGSLSVSLGEGGADDPNFGVETDTLLWSGRAPADEPQLAFAMEPGADITLFASLNGGTSTGLGLQETLADHRLTPFGPSMMLSPFDSLAGSVSGGGLVLTPGEGFDVALSAFTNTARDSIVDTSIQKFEIAKAFGSHIDLRLGLGMLQEQGGFLGARSSGAFGEDINSRSHFADLSIIAAISEQVDWFGSYSRGHSRIRNEQSSLFSDWSSAKSEAFGTGLVVRDLSSKNDSLSLMIGQPFRGDDAKTTLTVPVGRTPDGAVVTEQQRVDLTPSAREIISEAVYRHAWGGGETQQIGIGGFARFNPGHDADRAPELGFGIHYRWRF